MTFKQYNISIRVLGLVCLLFIGNLLLNWKSSAVVLTTLHTVTVTDPSVPVVMALPLKRDSGIFNVNQLQLTAPGGAFVGTSFTEKTRWDNNNLKWVVVRFNPTTTGNYTMVTGGVAVAVPTVSVVDSGSTLDVTTATGTTVKLTKAGAAPITSFTIGGVEQVSGSAIKLLYATDSKTTVDSNAGTSTVTVSSGKSYAIGQTVKFSQTGSFVGIRNGYVSPGNTTDNFLAFNGDLFLSGSQVALGGRELIFDRASTNFVLTTFDNIYIGSEPSVVQRTFPFADSFPMGLAAGVTVEDRQAFLEPNKTITNITGNVLTLSAPLTYKIFANTTVVPVTAAPGLTETLSITSATVVRDVSNFKIIKQDFNLGSNFPYTRGELYTYLYAGKGYVRNRIRLINATTDPANTVTDVILGGLSVEVTPAVGSVVASSDVVTTNSAATTRDMAGTGNSTAATTGTFSMTVEGLAQNFPSSLVGGSGKFTYSPIWTAQRFYANSAKTWDFYLGSGTSNAAKLSDSVGASWSANDVAQSKAFGQHIPPSQTWTSLNFGGSAEMAEAGNRTEAQLKVLYDVTAATPLSQSVPLMSLNERRWSKELYPGTSNDKGQLLGWLWYGNTTDEDNYNFGRYDLGWVLLREYLRTGNVKAFKLSSQVSKYMADLGMEQSSRYIGGGPANYLGFSRYERCPKFDQCTQTPRPTHNWIGALWAYGTLVDDPIVLASAQTATDRLMAQNFAGICDVDASGLDGTLCSFNESRVVAWPVWGLVQAYTFSGNATYLTKARSYLAYLRNNELAKGQRGYFGATGYTASGTSGIQSFNSGGYVGIPLVEYNEIKRHQGAVDGEMEAWAVEKGRWLVYGDGLATGVGTNRPMIGSVNAGSQRTVARSIYTWYPGTLSSETGSLGTAIPSLAIMLKSPDVGVKSFGTALWKDIAFYKDFGDVPVDIASRSNINLRSTQFDSSNLKVTLQMALGCLWGFPLVYNGVAPTPVVTPTPGPELPTPTPTPTPTPIPTPTPTPTPTPVYTVTSDMVGWNQINIGHVPQRGVAFLSTTDFWLYDRAAGIGGASDNAFFLVRKSNTYNGYVRMRIAQMPQGFAGAQVCVVQRASIVSTSKALSLCYTKEGKVQLNNRTLSIPFSLDLNSGRTEVSVGLPVWLRLSRTGNYVQAAYSTDSLTWIPVGIPAELKTYPKEFYYGIMSSSRSPGLLDGALVDSVQSTLGRLKW